MKNLWDKFTSWLFFSDERLAVCGIYFILFLLVVLCTAQLITGGIKSSIAVFFISGLISISELIYLFILKPEKERKESEYHEREERLIKNIKDLKEVKDMGHDK